MKSKKICSVLYGRVSSTKDSQDSSVTNQMILEDSRFDIIYKGFERRSGYKDFMKRTELINILYEYFAIETKKDNEVIYFKPSEFKKPIAKTLIISNLSRLARNTKISLQIIEALKLQDCNIYIQDLGKFNINNDLLISILASIEEGYSSSLSQKVKLGLDKSNAILSGKARGYKLVNKTKLVPNKEAKLIEKIFNMALTGEGAGTIGKKFNLGKSSILAILKNNLYIGFYKNKKDDRIVPIIKEDVFYRVQEQLKIRGKNPGDTRNKQLARKLKCNCCGGYYIRNLKKRYKDNKPYDYLFLQCNNQRRKADSCISERLEFNVLNEFIIRSLKEQKHSLRLSFDNIKFKNTGEELQQELEQKNKDLTNLMINASKFNMNENAFIMAQEQLLNEKDIILSKIEKSKTEHQQEQILRSLEESYISKLESLETLAKLNKWDEVYNEILSIDVSIKEAGENIEPLLSNLKFIEFNPLYKYLKEHEKPFRVNVI